jgi:hypothetical protein
MPRPNSLLGITFLTMMDISVRVSDHDYVQLVVQCDPIRHGV